VPLEAPSPLKLPPHRGEGGLGGGVGERLRVVGLGLAAPFFSNYCSDFSFLISFTIFLAAELIKYAIVV